MSEPVTKQRPTIDLDDFERRLRQASNVRDDDPLAELARLVGEQPDPYGDVFAREAATDRAIHDQSGRHEPDFGSQTSFSPRLHGDFAAIEAGLRSAAAPRDDARSFHQSTHAAAAQQGYADQPIETAGHHDGSYHDAASDAQVFGEAALTDEWDPRHDYAAVQPAAKSYRSLYMMGAAIAVGVFGVATAFAFKGHVGSSPREVKTIMADAGPTKIQPPADMSSDQTSTNAAELGNTGQAMPTKLVSREEQPVDLSQAVQDNAARDALASSAGGSDAASVPVPLSPGQVGRGGGSSSPGDDAMRDTKSFASDVTPKHVKVVSVRPDGTPIPDDTPQAAPRQNHSKTSDSVVKPAVKSTTRVTGAPKTIASLSADAADTPVPTKPSRKAKPQRVASLDTDQQETKALEAPAASKGEGGFAVQLAAPGSESEAKSVSSRLGKKFASVLHGRHLAFHKAQSNGRSVYRVRVGSLSREDAVSLCEKLKADGGSCFVAKD